MLGTNNTQGILQLHFQFKKVRNVDAPTPLSGLDQRANTPCLDILQEIDNKLQYLQGWHWPGQGVDGDVRWDKTQSFLGAILAVGRELVCPETRLHGPTYAYYKLCTH